MTTIILELRISMLPLRIFDLWFVPLELPRHDPFESFFFFSDNYKKEKQWAQSRCGTMAKYNNCV